MLQSKWSQKLSKQTEIQLALEREKLLKRQIELQEGLPHLYGWKFYPWARKFFESTNKMKLLCAANQISKSSTQIRQCIDWATNQKKWPKLWRRRPFQFWYLYPTKEVATIEFQKKWVTEFLPRGEFEHDKIYGWKAEYRAKDIFALHFNSGVTVYFKAYSQDVQHLQTGTCDAIFADEELPEDLYDELNLRIAATDGYFSMVFTATLGQQMWADAIEGKGFVEKFTDALKLQVSMFDCLKYEDGSDSHWTAQRIQKIVNSCRSQNEVLRRVYGRFVKDSGLKYPGFDRNKNIKPAHGLPKDWRIYAGVDIGSGGASGHPAAIVFVAVSPDFKKGRVFKGWRGDQIETTAKDVFDKYLELRGNMKVEVAYYDWQSKDFFVIASRSGEAFVPADKSHDSGESILNVLFKNEMLAIYEDEELKKLSGELTVLNKATAKQKAKDDFTDALRYACTKVPWDWEAITSDAPKEVKTPYDERKEELRIRRDAFEKQEALDYSVDSELDEWNTYYGD